MKIEIFEVVSIEDDIYQELLEQYKTNTDLKELLDEFIFSSEMIMAGDFRLITMLKYAVNSKNIDVYLIKDVDTNIFVWVIGKFLNDENISMYPLSKGQSEELQLEIRKVLAENGLLRE